MLALPIFPGRPMYCHAVRKCPGDTCRHKKDLTTEVVRFLVFALPIFPGSHPPSIVGVHVLNFCVRDGNRWTHMTINTNFSGYTLKTEHRSLISQLLKTFTEPALWSSFRLISISQLHTLLRFHL